MYYKATFHELNEANDVYIAVIIVHSRCVNDVHAHYKYVIN